MKRILIVGIILSFMSAAGFSQVPAPSVAPLSAEALAAILAQPTGTACPQPRESALLPDQPQDIQFMTCSAIATCSDTSGSVSCSYNSTGGSCTFENQNCEAGIRGYVNCNGEISYCPPCPCSGSFWCCECAATGDCMACCRCQGGTLSQCRNACGGGVQS
jgi:hypothetical protein